MKFLDRSKEVWKPVKRFKGLYDVSNMGRVRSLDRKVNQRGRTFKVRIAIKGVLLKGRFNRCGYPIVALSKNNKAIYPAVHRLVAQAFIPNPNKLLEINHKDGNKLNNRVENLEWSTRSLNIKHAYRIGLRHPLRGELNGKEKLTKKMVIKARAMRKKGMFYEDIAKFFNVGRTTISYAITGKSWAHVK